MRITFLTLALFLSSPSLAQIPVIDAASREQQIRAQVETLAKWQLQYDQMMSQIDQARQQYASTTGKRGLGEIINDSSLRNYLPSNWQNAYDSLRNEGYAGLNGRGASIYNANKIFDSCAHIVDLDQRKVCQAQSIKASQDKAVILDAYDVAKSRIQQIDLLMKQINNTQDLKAIAELQARIAIEQANIQNEYNKLQLYSMATAAEEQIQTQRQKEIEARTWSAKGGIKVPPLTFK